MRLRRTYRKARWCDSSATYTWATVLTTILLGIRIRCWCNFLRKCEQECDAVVFMGDAMDLPQAFSMRRILRAHPLVARAIERLCQRSKVYFILGNHDWTTDYEGMFPAGPCMRGDHRGPGPRYARTPARSLLQSGSKIPPARRSPPIILRSGCSVFTLECPCTTTTPGKTGWPIGSGDSMGGI